MKKKTYTLKFTKTGKEWKSFNDGLDILNDNTVYQMRWQVTGLKRAIQAWWSIKRKHHGSFDVLREEEI